MYLCRQVHLWMSLPKEQIEKHRCVKKLGQCAPVDNGNDPNGSLQAPEEKVTRGAQTAVKNECVRKWIELQSCSLLCLVCTATLLAVAWQQSVDSDQSLLLSSIQSLIHNYRACILIASVPWWTLLYFRLNVVGFEWSEAHISHPLYVSSFCFDRVTFSFFYWAQANFALFDFFFLSVFLCIFFQNASVSDIKVNGEH